MSAIARLPSRKVEAWHYTDLSQTDIASYPLVEQGFAGVGFGSSDVVGTILPAADLPLVDLNAQSFTTPQLLRISGENREPIRIVSTGQPGQFHNRLLVVVEAGASATLVETHSGQGRYFNNSVIEIDLAEGASLNHVVLQAESLDATHISTVGVRLAAKAAYRGQILHLGGQLVRREVHALMNGPEADFALDGASLVKGSQHIDNTTRVVHRAAHCPSRQLFKTVLEEQGHGVFQGTVLVERGAQKTNAHQLSRALLLSDRAAMDNKPELEIFADDVKCGHGATIGDIDENQLFYMKARGIDEAQARQLLIEAFLAEVVEQVADEGIRGELAERLHKELA
jgi:Fe-S cluster assembly protein SufD